MWSKSLLDTTREMMENMNAYGSFFKNINGEKVMLFPTEDGFEIIIFAKTKGFVYPPPLSEEKYYFKNVDELIAAGWAVD
ncbi:MAG: hypothetical protein LBG90_07345 [Spirochaetaceae bacterium]|jgi:hypothetical protein|nr:hypothetical protein [Spirochaetaceae bacterium]